MTLSNKKEQTAGIGNNTDEPPKHYAGVKEARRRRLHAIRYHFMKILENYILGKTTETNNRSVVAWGWDRNGD